MTYRLGVSDEQAQEVLAALHCDGYIEPATDFRDPGYWRTTLKGNALSLASAARPISRETAQRHLYQLLERVRQVNESTEFLLWVDRVLVSGSFLDESRPTVNDVDIAVDLKRRETDGQRHVQRVLERARAAAEAGRYFHTYLDKLLWDFTEVMLFLKARSRVISLHTTDDGILRQTASAILYQRLEDE